MFPKLLDCIFGESIEPADPRKTPCENKGYYYKDRFILKKDVDHVFQKGTIVQLIFDNQTKTPLFQMGKNQTMNIHIDNVQKFNF